MKISQEFTQFPKPSLIIVAGSHSANIYFAHQGNIEKIDSFKIETPIYSDKEGFFSRSGKGIRYGSGSFLEINKNEIFRKFAKELASRTEKLFSKSGSENIFLFSPSNIKRKLPQKFSQNLKSKIVYTIEGNFLESKPLDLIKMIQKKREGKKLLLVSESVIKILKKKI